MNQATRTGKCSMGELCSLKLTDANFSQSESGQGTEETLILMEERKSAINSRKYQTAVVIK